MLYKNILDLIGNTPILEFEDIFIKLEHFNLAGSTKDRVALKMIEALELENKLNKNSTVIEVTSGNTGIAIAMVCAIKRYKCIIIMPNNVSKEKINILKAYGANIILTNYEHGFEESIKIAKKLSKKKNHFFLNQFENENNLCAHKITAQEIINDLKHIDYLVCGIGTGGTITTLATELKKVFPNIVVIGVEEIDDSHQICGISPGFKPKILDYNIIDKVYKVSYLDAYSTYLELANNGLLIGLSSAASYYVSKIIKKENKDKIVLMISADNGIKYLNSLDINV